MFDGGDAVDFVVRVTETDKANEKLIFDAVRASFPDDQLIGEESSADAGSIAALTDAPTWIVDPVDGEGTSLTPSPPSGPLLRACAAGLNLDELSPFDHYDVPSRLCIGCDGLSYIGGVWMLRPRGYVHDHNNPPIFRSPIAL